MSRKRDQRPQDARTCPRVGESMASSNRRSQREGGVQPTAEQGHPAETVTTVDQLTHDPNNRRRHNDRNLKMIADGLLAVGPARSIVIDENDVILAGEGVTSAARAVGFQKVRIVEADGEELIAVRRRNLSADQKRSLALFDNRASELSEWNYQQLEDDRTAGLALQPFWTPEEEAELASRAAAREIDEITRR